MQSAVDFSAVCPGSFIREAGRQGADGIYLFARQDSFAAQQLPMKITNEAEAQAAVVWVRGALVDASSAVLCCTMPALAARRAGRALGTGRPCDTAVRSGGRNARAWHRRIAASSRIVLWARAA